MTPARRLLVGGIVVLAGAGGFAAGRALFRPSERVVQPIAFNHQKHVDELGMDCDNCHERYQHARHAGLPTLETCLGCHEDAVTEQPEEQKIRDLVAAGENDVFRKLFRIPDHTYYSHQRHAGIAEIPCETCHGPIAKSVTPPETPFVHVTMEFCLDCHERTGASSDCTHCHH